jgi:branched-chain amino acid transport system permease protein
MVVVIIVRPNGLFGSNRHDETDPLQGAHFLGDSDDSESITGRSGRWDKVLDLAPRVGVVALLMLGLFAPYVLGSNRLIALATFAAVDAIAVYSLWLCFRLAGVLLIAQAGFVGVGAYVTALVAIHITTNFYAQMALSIVAGAIVAGLFALVSLRASGSYFLIVLFALSSLLVIALSNGGTLTGGVNGLVLPTAPRPFGNAVDFSDPHTFYYLVFGLLCATVFGLWLVGRSRFGRLLTTLRDNEPLARSLGLNTFWYRVAALTLSGAVAGMGGTLYVYAQVGIEPDFFNAGASIKLVLMMILGGAGTLVGPAVGAATVIFLPEIFSFSPYQSQLAYGVLLVAIIVILPLGIVGTLRQRYRQVAAWFGVARRPVVRPTVEAIEP